MTLVSGSNGNLSLSRTYLLRFCDSRLASSQLCLGSGDPRLVYTSLPGVGDSCSERINLVASRRKVSDSSACGGRAHTCDPPWRVLLRKRREGIVANAKKSRTTGAGAGAGASTGTGRRLLLLLPGS
jgi:hypothetical protein